MWPLAAAFIDIALHRRGPEDLPASQPLLGRVLIAYATVVLATLAVISATQAQVIWILFEPAVAIVAVYLLLRLVAKEPLFLQTAAALFGTAVFVNVLALPVLCWNELLGGPPGELNAPGFLLLLLYVWSIDIAGYILSRAIGSSYIVGLAIVIGYEFASLAVLQALIPPAG